MHVEKQLSMGYQRAVAICTSVIYIAVKAYKLAMTGSIQAELFFYLFLNFLEFMLMGSDKILAQWRWERHRISENCLLIFGFLGPIGGWSGMYIFKHKTAPGKYLFRQNMRYCTIAHLAFWLWYTYDV